jgi:malate permease and related proteins
LTTYLQLFAIVLPVFLVVGLGIGLRRAGWVTAESEGSLFNIVINVAAPCLIFDSVVSNAALRDPANLLGAPLAGFALTLLGIGVAYGVGRSLGLNVGTGVRTFALTAGIANYGYLPLPIVDALWGPEVRGVLLVHNLGVEAAIWTGGILVISGVSLREGWRRLLNAPLFALVLAVAVNLSGLGPHVPGPVLAAAHWMGQMLVPLGLIMTGVSIQPHLGSPGALFVPRVSLGACLVRLLVLPVLFLAIAKVAPVAPELKKVLVVQSAMPTAVIPIILARVYGGQPLTAVQIVLITTAAALFTIPAWMGFGLAWLGL